MTALARVGREGVSRALALAIVVLLILLVGVPVGRASSTTTTQQTSAGPTCLDGGTPGMVPAGVTVAIVMPIFTSTPYSQYAWGSFYGFYKLYLAMSGNFTGRLDWLNTSVKWGEGYNHGWGHSLPIYSFLTSEAAMNCGLVLGKNLFVVTDINVSQGALFNSRGERNFDAIVIGHEEYVTQAEYDQLREFVAAGGRLVAMSSNAFYARITFNPRNLMETFVVGHGYAYNGRSAWHSNQQPFAMNTSRWFGGTYCCFKRFQYQGAVVNGSDPIGAGLGTYFGSTVFQAYKSHEENAVTNFTHTSIVATFLNKSGTVVASYAHGYGKGAVFCLCVFGEDMIAYDRATQYFLVESLSAPLPLQEVQPSGGLGGTGLAVVAAVVLVTLAVPVVVVLRRAKAK
jgi:hypothetical protein